MLNKIKDFIAGEHLKRDEEVTEYKTFQSYKKYDKPEGYTFSHSLGTATRLNNTFGTYCGGIT